MDARVEAPAGDVRRGGSAPTVTIGIKALNEEAPIGAALASARAAARCVNGDVVLADSGSTDRTVDIARALGVRVTQIADSAARSCGAGAQLAYQAAAGDLFYILDGDMLLDPAFLPAAVQYLDAHPECAGVGGLVREVNTNSDGFKIRARSVATQRDWLPGVVRRLECGGLYRASAIREVGYFADKNLHAYEEFELAARLRSRGWTLARIDVPAVDHLGYQSNAYALLWRRLRSKYAFGAGEVLRGAIGRRHCGIVLRELKDIRYAGVVFAWWVAMVGSAFLAPTLAWKAGLVLGLLLLPLAVLALRRGSLRLGLYSLAARNVSAIGFLGGLISKRSSPFEPVASRSVDASNSLARS